MGVEPLPVYGTSQRCSLGLQRERNWNISALVRVGLKRAEYKFMNLENHNSDSSSPPGIENIQEGQRLLSQGELSKALKQFKHVLEHTNRETPENLLLRIDACNGLIVRSALKKKPGSIQRSIQVLLDELALQSELNLDIGEQIAARINAVTETLGAMRSWYAVKKMSRLVFKIVCNETPDSLAHRIRALNNLGSALIAERRFDDAAHIWHCAIEDHGAKAAKTCPAPLATIHNNLAELLRLQGEFSRSQQHHQQALELRSSFPQDHVLHRQSRFNLAQIQAETFHYHEAERNIQAYLDSFNQKQEARLSPDYLRAQALQARLLMETGRYLSAEKLIDQLARSLPQANQEAGRLEADIHLMRFELAIHIHKSNIIQRESARLPQIFEQAGLLNTVYEARFNLLQGILANRQGESESFEKADAYFHKAIEQFQSRLNPNHPFIAQTLFQLAETFSRSMRQMRGGQTAGTALSIYEQGFGTDSIPMLVGVLETSRIILLQNKYEKSKQLLREAMSIYKRHPSTCALFVMNLFQYLAQTYLGLNKPKVAAHYYRQAWKTLESSMELPASQKIEVVDRAFELSRQASHLQDAIMLLQRKIELLGEEFHSAHPSVIEATEQLGRLYLELGEPDHAADQLSKILPLRCTELGEDSAQAIELMKLTAQAYQKAGQEDKAKQIEKEIQAQEEKSSHVLSDLL